MLHSALVNSPTFAGRCVNQIDSSLHRCNVLVPSGVAALLQTYPALVAPAVHAFCQRDASQLQVRRSAPDARRCAVFHGLLSAGDSRHALLPARDAGLVVGHVHQMPVRHACPPQLHAGPAHRMGAALARRPQANGSRAGNETGALSFHAFNQSTILIGEYLQAVGFELLANEESCRQSDADYKVELDPRWNRFVETLAGKGFFQVMLGGARKLARRDYRSNPIVLSLQDYVEHSKPYVELLEKAREFFVGSVSNESPKQPVVLRLLQTVSADTDKFRREEANLPPDDGKYFRAAARDRRHNSAVVSRRFLAVGRSDVPRRDPQREVRPAGDEPDRARQGGHLAETGGVPQRSVRFRGDRSRQVEEEVEEALASRSALEENLHRFERLRRVSIVKSNRFRAGFVRVYHERDSR